MAATTLGEMGMQRTRTDWGAIWAGMFSFIAIWSVFGSLGMAIFASAATPAANHPVTAEGWGIGIWAIILTIIAMYVAGRVTGHLANLSRRQDGLLHGQIMFGLSCVAALVIAVLAGSWLTGTQGVADTGHAYSAVSGMGWAGFFALLLGWFAALGGAVSGVRQRARLAPDTRSTDTLTVEEERNGIRRVA